MKILGLIGITISLIAGMTSPSLAADKAELRRALRKIEQAEQQLFEAKSIIEDQLIDVQKAWNCNYNFPFSDLAPFKGEGDSREAAVADAIFECSSQSGNSDCRYQSNKNGYMVCKQNF